MIHVFWLSLDLVLPTCSTRTAPACWRDASGLYKRQGSEDLDVAEPAQLTNLVDQQPSSEVSENDKKFFT